MHTSLKQWKHVAGACGVRTAQVPVTPACFPYRVWLAVHNDLEATCYEGFVDVTAQGRRSAAAVAVTRCRVSKTFGTAGTRVLVRRISTKRYPALVTLQKGGFSGVHSRQLS